MIGLTNSSAKYLDQKADLTFKKIFSNHPDLLISLLNSLLPTDEDCHIESIKTTNMYDYTFINGYNNKNQLTSVQYPNLPQTITYTYDQYGNNIQTNAGSNVIYKLESYNGLTASSSFNGALTTTNTKDSRGFLTNVSLTKGDDTLESFTTDYDGATGNLMSRQRNAQKEKFWYDELDRLTEVSENKLLKLTVTYLPNGNINGMTDVGMYTYDDTDRPHAVRSVDNFSEEISGEPATTTFNDINKISVISGDGYAMNLDYGPDCQRWSSVLKKNGTAVRSTVYMGDYEEVTENGVTRGFYYLGDNVLAVRENSAVKYYNIFTDNLGSILSVMDETGNKVFEATYSAWGRQTVDKNTIGLHRGYCGHEMLDEFQLINMNGRLYDPMIGRFLSPDNYVQLPGNSQSYNRYSYCMNNPLKYNDPSGEFLNLVFGGFIGGFLNWASHGFQFNAKGLGYFATGAVASAVSTGIASGMDVAMAGGNFWKGAAGLAHGVSSTGFIAGAATGASSGFAGGFILSAGNSWVDGHSFGNGLLSGMRSGGIGALSAGVTGGLMGGLDAIDNGVNFWTGKSSVKVTGAMAYEGLLPKGIDLGGKVNIKYVGRFEGQKVFESELLGNINNNYRAVTIPDIGIIAAKGVFTSGKNTGLVMMQHEFGHILQYAKVGAENYYKVIATESLANCGVDMLLDMNTHSTYWTETWANFLSKKYFGTSWLGVETYSTRLSQFYFPSKDISMSIILTRFVLPRILF